MTAGDCSASLSSPAVLLEARPGREAFQQKVYYALLRYNKNQWVPGPWARSMEELQEQLKNWSGHDRVQVFSHILPIIPA